MVAQLRYLVPQLNSTTSSILVNYHAFMVLPTQAYISATTLLLLKVSDSPLPMHFLCMHSQQAFSTGSSSTVFHPHGWIWTCWVICHVALETPKISCLWPFYSNKRLFFPLLSTRTMKQTVPAAISANLLATLQLLKANSQSLFWALVQIHLSKIYFGPSLSLKSTFR